MYSDDVSEYVDYGESWTDADLLASEQYGAIIGLKCDIYAFNDMIRAHFVFTAQEQQDYDETMLILGDEITERDMTHLRNVNCICTYEQVKNQDCSC